MEYFPEICGLFVDYFMGGFIAILDIAYTTYTSGYTCGMAEKQLVHMQFDLPLLKRLDDFRFKHRFESRSDAARWLLKTCPRSEAGAQQGWRGRHKTIVSCGASE